MKNFLINLWKELFGKTPNTTIIIPAETISEKTIEVHKVDCACKEKKEVKKVKPVKKTQPAKIAPKTKKKK